VAKRAEVLRETLLSNARFRLSRMLVEIDEGDGHTRRIDHEIYHYGRAAAVLPYDAERHVVLLVRQFRLAAFLATGALDLLEAPAGMLDNDSAEVAAEREAMEETGVRIRELTRAFNFISNPAGMTETIACFLARYSAGDAIAEGGGVDADEWIERVELDAGEAFAMIERGEIIDGKTVALLAFAKAKGFI
jgi:nudix-type nucleoside diphosphatase (YffH/AdpP family)